MTECLVKLLLWKTSPEAQTPTLLPFFHICQPSLLPCCYHPVSLVGRNKSMRKSSPTMSAIQFQTNSPNKQAPSSQTQPERSEPGRLPPLKARPRLHRVPSIFTADDSQSAAITCQTKNTNKHNKTHPRLGVAAPVISVTWSLSFFLRLPLFSFPLYL